MPCLCCFVRTDSTSGYCAQCRGTFHCACGGVTCSCGNLRMQHSKICRPDPSAAKFLDFGERP